MISRISTVCCAAASNCCCFRDPWLFCRRIYFASPYQWLAVLRLASPCSCFVVKAMPTDPWGQPLTPGPRFALQACSALLCAALRTPAHGLARQLQTHARPISLVRGGLAYLAWQFKPGWPHWPLAPTFSRPFAAGSESKPAACQALFPPRKVAETKTSTPQAC